METVCTDNQNAKQRGTHVCNNMELRTQGKNAANRKGRGLVLERMPPGVSAGLPVLAEAAAWPQMAGVDTKSSLERCRTLPG